MYAKIEIFFEKCKYLINNYIFFAIRVFFTTRYRLVRQSGSHLDL